VKGGFTNLLRNRDYFGEPVQLNFKGDSTYKTTPGGIISLCCTICILAYTALKLKYMIHKEEWQVT